MELLLLVAQQYNWESCLKVGRYCHTKRKSGTRSKNDERVVKVTFEEIASKVQTFALSWQKGRGRKPRAKIWAVKALGKGNIRSRVGQSGKLGLS